MVLHHATSFKPRCLAALITLVLSSTTAEIRATNGPPALKNDLKTVILSHSTSSPCALEIAVSDIAADSEDDYADAGNKSATLTTQKLRQTTFIEYDGDEGKEALLAATDAEVESLVTDIMVVLEERFRAAVVEAAKDDAAEQRDRLASDTQGGIEGYADFDFPWMDFGVQSWVGDMDKEYVSHRTVLGGWERFWHDGSLQEPGGGVFERGLQAGIPRVELATDVPDDCPTEEVDFLKIDNTWVNIALTFVCVVCAGLAAGLTMGLVSIEPLEMAIKQRSGTADEKKQASRILPLVNRHHFLLVTLLLFNSLANEALPIFLGNLVPSWLAVILSVSMVLFFGEILPSAIFTGKGQLAIASGMAWLVYFLMFVLGPIAWPLSWMLDRVLGIEGYKRYNRAEISALVEVQHELANDDVEDVTNMPLHPDEVAIVHGVLQTAQKCVSEAMITMDKVFCLRQDETLSGSTMADIMAAGYSRVLVYEGSDTRNIRGYLQVKKLIVLNPDDERNISTLMLRIPVVVSPSKSLLELLNTFQTGRSHLALVSNSPGITLEALKHGVRLEGAARPVGIITLEDIIEEIIQEEIMDESDRLTEFIENRARDTLLRFTRRRRERKILGKYNALGRTVPAGKNGPTSPALSRSGNASSRSVASVNNVSIRSLDDGGDYLPAPPGVNERASLISSSAAGRPRRRSRSPVASSRGRRGDPAKDAGSRLSAGVVEQARLWRQGGSGINKAELVSGDSVV